MSIQEARRAAFEKTYADKHFKAHGFFYPETLYRWTGGKYASDLVEAAWWGWNAALDSVELSESEFFENPWSGYMRKQQFRKIK